MEVAVRQEKELKMFRDGLKQDMKMLKHEVEMLPKETRKEALRQRKEEKEIEHAEKVSGWSPDVSS